MVPMDGHINQKMKLFEAHDILPDQLRENVLSAMRTPSREIFEHVRLLRLVRA